MQWRDRTFLVLTGLVALCASCGTVEFRVDDRSTAETKLVFSSEPGATALVSGFFSPFAVTVEDGFGHAALTSSATIALSAYLDSACITTPASGALAGTPVSAVNGSAVFGAVQYDTAATIYLKASSGTLSSACSTAVVVLPKGIALSWIGELSAGGGAAQWAESGTAAAGSTPDYALRGSDGVTVDSSYAYVADTQNGRIVRFDRASGAAMGWIGEVGSNAGLTGPAGSGNCPSTSVGTFTGGWCSGGAAQIDASAVGTGGMAFPAGITNDGAFLYVLDEAGRRLLRFALATGAFAGWVGGVSSFATIACESGTPVLGQVTPSWCMGGSAQSGDGNGMFDSDYEGVATDGVSIYVGDAHNGEVYKFDVATGAFVGWIGKIGNTTSISCQSGAPLLGQATPSWCTGGMCAGGTGDGMFFAGGSGNAFMSLAVAAGYLYVSDGEYGPGHVQRFDAGTGAFAGWIGEVASTGSINCGPETPAIGQPATAWCTGGSWNHSSKKPGGFSGPSGLYVDSTYLYVADAFNNTLQRFALSGAFSGWKGMIQASPSRGEPGCSGALAGTYTPGWCMDGTYDITAGSTNLGQIHTPAHLGGDAVYLYVADQGNNRVLRVSK